MVDKNPTCFVGLDEDTVVVGFYQMSPLQVWDLAAGKLVREFEGQGRHCRSMTNLPRGRIAAGWKTGSQRVVAVFDAATGKQLQELTGFTKGIFGLALVEDHLLTMCMDQTLRVWSQDAAGKFSMEAEFATCCEPLSAMTVLSPSTVAMPMSNPAHIEIWDWKVGKRVGTLDCFEQDMDDEDLEVLEAGYVVANALLPDGRLVAGDDLGTILVGSPEDWAMATTFSNGSALTGVLAGHDGSFVTTDMVGDIKLWRNGTCEVTLIGGCTDSYYRVPIAVIGRRLIIIGENRNLLVAE